MSELKHLWEIKHPYYCEESNYFRSNNLKQIYKSFKEFIERMNDADLDMNLLFRWDWHEENSCEDSNYRNGELSLFFMAQRKGHHFCRVVSVCRNDESDVVEYLKVRKLHLNKLWEGID